MLAAAVRALAVKRGELSQYGVGLRLSYKWQPTPFMSRRVASLGICRTPSAANTEAQLFKLPPCEGTPTTASAAGSTPPCVEHTVEQL
jgi:hypothetical protein